MKDIFKGQKKYLRLLSAIILIVLSYYLVTFFAKSVYKKGNIKEPSVPSPKEEKTIGEEAQIDFDEFGVVHIKVESPSFEKSNFDVNPNTSIEVYFNAKVNLDDVNAKFELMDTESEEKVPVKVILVEEITPGGSTASSTWKWQRVWKQKVVFTPLLELKPVTRYSVFVRAGYYDELSKESAERNFKFEFMTADLPGVLSSNVDGGGIKKGEIIKVFFNSPMDKADLINKTRLLPPAEPSIEVNDKIMTIADLESGSYELTIPADAMDIYGRELGEVLRTTFIIL